MVGTGVANTLVPRSKYWMPLLEEEELRPIAMTALLLSASIATPQLLQPPPEKDAVPSLPLDSVLVTVVPLMV